MILPWLAMLLLAGCSVTQHLPEGQQLYTGLRKMDIQNEDRSSFGQTALNSAEKPMRLAPNGAMFGSPYRRWPWISPGLFFYNRLAGDSTRSGKWLFDKLATKPIFISDVNPSARARVAQNILREQGYLQAQVTSEIIAEKKDSLQAKVQYHIDMGQPYLYDSIQYLSPILLQDSTVLNHREITQMHRGDNFSVDALAIDRKIVGARLRENGFYYFRPNDITFEADTLIAPGKVWLRTLLSANLPMHSRRPWQLGRIEVLIQRPSEIGSTPRDSLQLDSNLLVRFTGKMPIRRSVLNHRIKMRSGQIYSQKNEDATLSALSTLGTFAGTQFVFTPRQKPDTLQAYTIAGEERKVADSVSVNRLFLPYSEAGTLDLGISLLQDKLWDFSVEGLYKVKSNNFMGPGLNLGLARHNVFRGGEVLSFDLYGSYEWQTGHSPFSRRALDINTYQLGADLSLTVPTISFPGLRDKFLGLTAQTTLTASASILNRAGFFRMNALGLSLVYDFSQSSIHRHSLTPLSLTYSSLRSRSLEFDTLMMENPALRLGLQSQFIARMSYNYTYDNIFNRSHAHHLWMRFGISEGGNLLNAGYALAGRPYNNTKTLLNVPFAQFVKGTAEIRYTFTIDRNQSLAMRLGSGVIYSFGNMKVPPYSEQFYVGGANSIRAFTVRSLGPGSYVPDTGNKYGFIDQTGNFKLEANLEYRGKLMGNLHGAVFLDSGNVWLIRPDERRPGGSLREITSARDFFNQIALGTGVGLRYDLSFLVVRIDTGFGLHLPYTTTRRGYYNIPRFSDGLGFHLAIGYPF